MGTKEVLIPIFVVPIGCFVIYFIWQWHANHELAIEALRLQHQRAEHAQTDAHEQDIEAAFDEIGEVRQVIEEALAGAGGVGTRDRAVGSGSPLPPV